MNKEIEMNGKKVIIANANEWSYDSVSHIKIKELNTALYEEITAKVEFFLLNEIELIQKAQDEKDTKQFEENKKASKEFELILEKNYSDVIEKNVFGIIQPNYRDWSFNARSFYIKSAYNSIRIKFDDKVYSNSGWGATTTTKVWKLTTIDTKTRRYVKLETAIKKAVELLAENTENKERVKNFEDLQVKKYNAVQKYAEENGYEFEEKKDYNRSYTNCYRTYTLLKGSVSAKVSCSDDLIIVINSYTIKKDGITIEELSEVSK